MDIKEYIFNNSNPSYTAQYGWQQFFGDSMFTFGYINSYKEAADTLVEELTPDLYLFPIMFTYRHYLELALKNICEKNMTEEKYKDFIFKASHNLGKIWCTSKEILELQLNNDEINFIEQIVIFFDALDSDSFAFRYEKTRNQKHKSIKEDYLTINTLNLKKYIDRVDDILRFTYDSI